MKYGYSIKTMKYGYMPSFKIDLLSEIDFAKKHFDFIELTLKQDLSEYKPKYISELKTALKNFQVLGHLHWDIDLLKELEKVKKSIKISKELGVKKITIHPSASRGQNIEQIKQDNLSALKKIADFCRRNKIQLLLENAASTPFNQISNSEYLINSVPYLDFTLDIGHAYRTSRVEVDKFLKKFKNKIKHIHLHNALNGFDHLPFKDKNELKEFIKSVKNIGYNGTITLEMFFILKNNKYIPMDGKDRKNLLIKQLEFVRTK